MEKFNELDLGYELSIKGIIENILMILSYLFDFCLVASTLIVNIFSSEIHQLTEANIEQFSLVTAVILFIYTIYKGYSILMSFLASIDKKIAAYRSEIQLENKNKKHDLNYGYNPNSPSNLQHKIVHSELELKRSQMNEKKAAQFTK